MSNQDFVRRLPEDRRASPAKRGAADDRSATGSRRSVQCRHPGTNITTRPTFIINDMVTWTKSAHTLKFGMEYRKIMGNLHQTGNQAGTFTSRAAPRACSASTAAARSPASCSAPSTTATRPSATSTTAIPRQNAWIFHAGDTWRVNDKLTLDYGLRWDYYSPSSEKYRPLLLLRSGSGANPGAGGRPGRLAFAGDGMARRATARAIPRAELLRRVCAPARRRLQVQRQDRAAQRLGHLLHAGVLPRLGRRHRRRTGSRQRPRSPARSAASSRRSSCDRGCRRTSRRRPIIQSDYQNGQGIMYRPLDANKRSYSHQWNITVDRELGQNMSLSVAYVGSAGRRLPSSIDPINAIDPTYLSMGDRLNDEFQPGMTSLDGVPLPYAGWVEQMTGCAPSVAQALRPYPQYCDNLQGLNENLGESKYNSLQMKLEKRFSNGIYALVSYTLSKTMSERVGQHPARRPDLERRRRRHLAVREGPEQDRGVRHVPHVLSTAFVYELPLGRGRSTR